MAWGIFALSVIWFVLFATWLFLALRRGREALKHIKKERIEEYVKSLLGHLRRQEVDFRIKKTCAEALKLYISFHSFNLESIGTSERELDELLAKVYRERARELLQIFWEGDPDYERHFNEFNDLVREGNLKYPDLDTNQEKLTDLRLKGQKAAARAHYKAMCRELEAAGLRFEDINSEVKNG